MKFATNPTDSRPGIIVPFAKGIFCHEESVAAVDEIVENEPGQCL
jgi:hypothetical protein